MIYLLESQRENALPYGGSLNSIPGSGTGLEQSQEPGTASLTPMWRVPSAWAIPSASQAH